jgi:predicted deacylase
MSRQGVVNAAIRQGQLRGEMMNKNYPPSEQVMVDTSDPASNFLAPLDCLFEPTVELGQKVTRGQRVAWLHDFQRIDEPPIELVAPHDGYIICQAWGARVIQGQVITQIGKPLEWTK